MNQSPFVFSSLRLCVFARKNKHYGFTLIELIFVLAIIAIVLSVTATEFRFFIAGQSTVNAANKLVALARHGRALAISEGRTVRLTVDTSTGGYDMESQDGAVFRKTGSGIGSLGGLPEGTTATWVPAPGVQPATAPAAIGTNNPNSPTGAAQSAQSGPAQSVQFFSDGRCDMMSLVLTGRNGNKIELGAPSESEMWRVVKEGQP